MIKREFFVCEVCGEQYTNEKECKRCEASHIVPKQIVQSSYIPSISDYPYGIKIKMSDGKVLLYSRC